MKEKYTVKNEYGINGETSHRTAEAALKAAKKREGFGWVVEDSKGNRYDFDFDGNARITRFADSDDSFDTVECPHCGEEFERLDHGDVNCPHCDGLCGN